MPLDTGVRLGPYEIISPTGADGGGEVYKANDTEQNRTVAIKLLPPGLSDNSELKQRFEGEVKTLSRLCHPHICTPHEIRREADTDFLVMEYVEGETLAKRLERGALPLDEALKVAIDITDALNRAHAEGLVHRSLRPSNVMLTPEGPKLLDFGMASWEPPKEQTSPPVIDGRAKVMLPDLPDDVVRYMAPEQVEGRDADARSDIFAFGAILYEMVTGEKAFDGTGRCSLPRSHRSTRILCRGTSPTRLSCWTTSRSVVWRRTGRPLADGARPVGAVALDRRRRRRSASRSPSAAEA